MNENDGKGLVFFPLGLRFERFEIPKRYLENVDGEMMENVDEKQDGNDKKNLHWWMRWERTKGLDLDEKFGKRKILTGGYDLDMVWNDRNDRAKGSDWMRIPLTTVSGF